MIGIFILIAINISIAIMLTVYSLKGKRGYFYGLVFVYSLSLFAAAVCGLLLYMLLNPDLFPGNFQSRSFLVIDGFIQIPKPKYMGLLLGFHILTNKILFFILIYLLFFSKQRQKDNLTHRESGSSIQGKF